MIPSPFSREQRIGSRIPKGGRMRGGRIVERVEVAGAVGKSQGTHRIYPVQSPSWHRVPCARSPSTESARARNPS
jgi:hypothetical protein